MPAYDFRCSACGRTTTEYPMIADRDMLRCGACEGVLHRLFSPPRSRAVVRTPYQQKMRALNRQLYDAPDFREVGDMTLNEVKAESARYKKEATEERDKKLGRIADEYVSELGETREAVLAELTRDTGPDPPAPSVQG